LIKLNFFNLQSFIAEKDKFIFDKAAFSDSVVIPYYRHFDLNPQFYCVQSIDYSQSPLSQFPTSSNNNMAVYETFYQYFAIKYNILITDLTQPLLVVSHPSTRLNLLTPRYMNLKATVLQKTFQTGSASNASHSSHKKSSGSSGSSRIYLVPELVNVHPLSASVWKKSLCLPAILYRINSLLVVEELRREIAQSTGVGVPWTPSGNEKFSKLSFAWDRTKEIECSNVPDVEIDINTIQNQIESETKIKNNNEKMAAASKEQGEPVVDSSWNFEISTWDESCLKEVGNPLNANGSKAATAAGGAGGLFFINNETNNLLKSKLDKDIVASGWLDDEEESSTKPKTLFIDTNDMDFFGDEFMDDFSDEELYQNSLHQKESLKNVINFNFWY
jgi:hypothetical protein